MAISQSELSLGVPIWQQAKEQILHGKAVGTGQQGGLYSFQEMNSKNLGQAPASEGMKEVGSQEELWRDM